VPRSFIYEGESEKRGNCTRCHRRPSVVRWGDLPGNSNSFVRWWCRRCFAEFKLTNARLWASQIPTLEAELEAEGGPRSDDFKLEDALVRAEKALLEIRYHDDQGFCPRCHRLCREALEAISGALAKGKEE